MDDETQKIGQLQEKLFEILKDINANYKDWREYPAVRMNMVNCLKEVNAMRIKSIVGDIMQESDENE